MYKFDFKPNNNLQEKKPIHKNENTEVNKVINKVK